MNLRKLMIVLLILFTLIAPLSTRVPVAFADTQSSSSPSSNLYADFNNDGFDDLAIGVEGEDIGTIGGAGAVNVLYGSSGGLQVVSPDDQFWHQDKLGVRDKCETGNFFGNALAVGDFNHDGFDDLAIGVAWENIGTTIENAGAVNVLYGSSGGLQASSPNDQFWHQDKPGVRDKSENSFSGDYFGWALAS